MFKKLEIRKKYHCITYWNGDVMVGRKCTVCGEDKLVEEFNFSNKEKGTRKGYCKKCESEKHKEYRSNNLEKEREALKKLLEEKEDISAE